MTSQVFSGICNTPFWNDSATWDTPTPAFTPCFTDTVLIWAPAILLWICFPYTLWDYLTAKRPTIGWNYFNIIKLLTAISLAIVGLAHAIYEGVLRGKDDPTVVVTSAEVIGVIISFITYLLLVIFLHFQRMFGFVNGGAIWFYLLFQIFCTGISIPTYIQFTDHQSNSELAFIYIEFAIQIILFLICSFPDRVANLQELMASDTLYGQEKAGFKFDDSDEKAIDIQKKRKRICPKETASFPSKLTFWWFNRVVWIGFRRPLTIDDLWQIRLTDRARKLFERYNEFWGHKSFSERNNLHEDKANGHNIGTPKLDQTQQHPKTNSISIIARQFWPYFLWPSLARLVTDNLQLANPTVMKYMIAFTTNATAPFWQGIFYTLIFVVVNVFTSITSAYHQYRMSVLGMRIRACLIGAVYRKSLVLSNHSKKDYTTGEIVNLMAVDSQRFVDLLPWLCFLWTAPIQIAIALYLLWNELGISVLGGLVLMILFIPINGYIAGIVKGIQTRQMGLKDKRLKAINEMLNGIKVLKLYAWEQAFIDNIQAIRVQELNYIRKAGYISTVFNVISACSPFMVSCLTFAIYILIDKNNILTAEKAFVSIAYFNLLRIPLTMIPNMMSNLIMTMVSVKRLNKFLNSDETTPYVMRRQDPANAISISDASFNWEHLSDEKIANLNVDSSLTLAGLNLDIQKGKLVAVVGNVGSGKSSFLGALLGEMEKISGKVNISEELQLAYVSQQAWIQNATVRDNIVFGSKFNEKKYQQVIEACALKPDLAMLTAGDQTEIGEKGINLSGGQKQRVSIARACYSDADLYLFDDPLSAVDSHVGKHIFDQVLSNNQGILKRKTRVLVTNALYMLSNVDQIVLLKRGGIEAVGSYDELMQKSTIFYDLIANYSKSAADDVEDATEVLTTTLEEVEEEMDDNGLDEFLDVPSPVGSLSKRKTIVFKERHQSVLSGISSKLSSIHTATKPSEMAPKSKLVEAEHMETGQVTFGVYMKFFRALSLVWTIMIVVNYLLITVANTGSSFWLNAWTADVEASSGYYLLIYFLIGLAQACFVVIGWISVVTGTLRASRTLHWRLMKSIVHAPMHFFDTTPLGRIVNRFSKDFDVLDTFIQLILRVFLNTTFQVLATFFTVSYNTPIFMAVVVPFVVIYYLIQRFYVATSRQLKRIESVTRSPIFTHFSETINGVSTIKAYTASERFMVEFDRRVDNNQRCFFPSAMANCWLQVRLEFMANILIFFASFFVALSKDTTGEGGLSGGDTGLSLSYALNITTALNMCVRMMTELENQVVSVERISEYTEVTPEADWFKDNDSRVSPDWPEQGVITFDGYGTRYRPGLDLVLRKVDIATGRGEKIGIVGRTGAGKSSLTLALFRIIEAANGKISMDGIDISSLGLQTLRSRITIIPQDPVLFCGTIRTNLDPFDKYTDEQLWHVLELSHLKSFVKSLELGLQHVIAEAGENLSVGQRQLICLARALLRRTNVLVLDEATAAVDLETDSLIQTTIRAQFSHCTVLTIAHRLHTILDSDRVMVLDSGNVAEFESPKSLLANDKSIFYSLARDAGIV